MLINPERSVDGQSGGSFVSAYFHMSNRFSRSNDGRAHVSFDCAADGWCCVVFIIIIFHHFHPRINNN